MNLIAITISGPWCRWAPLFQAFTRAADKTSRDEIIDGISQAAKLISDAQQYIPGGVNSPVRSSRAVGGTPPFIARGSGAHARPSAAGYPDTNSDSQAYPKSDAYTYPYADGPTSGDCHTHTDVCAAHPDSGGTDRA